MTPRRHSLCIWLGLLTAVAGCATAGDYVWVEAIPSQELAPRADYLIGAGDLLGVRVYGQENLSSKVRVRGDGMISLPLISDQEAAGLTPAALARMLEAAFKTFVKAPVVTVAVEETRPLQVSVLGEVAKPGTYKLTPGTDVLTALALAGGITPFAQRDGIYIVRRVSVTATPGAQRAMRIRFRYQALTRGDAPAAGFQVQDADVLVVE